MFNKAARTITGLSSRERVTPKLMKHYWLPLEARLIFKFCLMTFKALKIGEPRYLKDKLVEYNDLLNVETRHDSEIKRLKEPI